MELSTCMIFRGTVILEVHMTVEVSKLHSFCDTLCVACIFIQSQYEFQDMGVCLFV